MKQGEVMSKPLIDYYTNAGKIRIIDGTMDIEDVFAAIVTILGE